MQALNPSVISSCWIVPCQLRGNCSSPYKLFFGSQTYDRPFRSSFRNLPIVLRKLLPSSHSEEILSVHRAESHSSRGWQRWPTRCGHLGCDRLERMYFRSLFRLPEKTLCTESRLEKTVRLNLDTHVEPIILRPFGAGTNSKTSCLDML